MSDDFLKHFHESELLQLKEICKILSNSANIGKKWKIFCIFAV